MHFLEWQKYLIWFKFHWSMFRMFQLRINQHWFRYGLVPSRRQVIIGTNDGQVYWCIHTFLSLSDFNGNPCWVYHWWYHFNILWFIYSSMYQPLSTKYCGVNFISRGPNSYLYCQTFSAFFKFAFHQRLFLLRSQWIDDIDKLLRLGPRWRNRIHVKRWISNKTSDLLGAVLPATFDNILTNI